METAGRSLQSPAERKTTPNGVFGTVPLAWRHSTWQRPWSSTRQNEEWQVFCGPTPQALVPLEPRSDGRLEGVVAEWNDRGYGFIVFTDGRRAYVHHTSVNSSESGPIDLKQGEKVHAIVVEDVQNAGKWAALDVHRKTLPVPPPCACAPAPSLLPLKVHAPSLLAPPTATGLLAPAPPGEGAERMAGVVREWNPRGFGFVLFPDGRRAYVHHSFIGGGNLQEGEAVVATIVEDAKNPGKWAATNVQRRPTASAPGPLQPGPVRGTGQPLLQTTLEVNVQGPTVAALADLLHRSGGRRPASAVGFLYSEAHGAHRRVIQSHGGVSGFVGAHADVFALELPGPGETCPIIRLLTPAESAAATAEMALASSAAPSTPKAAVEKPLCRFHKTGQCLKGADCRFSHNLPEDFTPPFERLLPEDGSPLSAEDRASLLRKQVSFYLSDENLRRDAFFQGLISASDGGWISISTLLGCRRRMRHLAATENEVLAALEGEAWLELRNSPPGSEAVRRRDPPPVLQETWAAAVSPREQEALEASLQDRPLELLRDRAHGWQAVVDDAPRRSFCLLRRNTWSRQTLLEEFETISSSTEWCTLRSKKEAVTRSTAWYVPKGCSCRYTYGDVSVKPHARPAWLAGIEARVLGEGCGLAESEWPESVNVNLYENEGQNVGWHSDDESLFSGNEQDCRIISASWGAARNFEVALKERQPESGRLSIVKDSMRKIVLLPGDLLAMEGLFQKHYSHQLAKGPSALEKPPPPVCRVNLTWRHIVKHKPYCSLARKR